MSKDRAILHIAGISIEVTVHGRIERPATVSRPGATDPWESGAARRRLLDAVLQEGARCPRARWPELAQVVRELADGLESATGTPAVLGAAPGP